MVSQNLLKLRMMKGGGGGKGSWGGIKVPPGVTLGQGVFFGELFRWYRALQLWLVNFAKIRS